MKMLLLLMLVVGGGASASTIPMYTPGGAPCAGACGYEWAVERFSVPDGESVPMIIPAGSAVVKMTYAKDGVPYATDMSAILAEDEPGEGYLFQRDGLTLMMVKLDTCQNWALMVPPSAAIGPQTEALRPLWTPPVWVGVPVVVPTAPPVIIEPPPPPSSVPLLGGGVMLMTALGSLMLMKGKKHV